MTVEDLCELFPTIKRSIICLERESVEVGISPGTRFIDVIRRDFEKDAMSFGDVIERLRVCTSIIPEISDQIDTPEFMTYFKGRMGMV